MYCPFLSIGKDKPAECLEEKCGLYVADGIEDLLGCAYTQSTIMMTRMVNGMYALFEETNEDVVKELHGIAQGTAYIPDLS